MLRLVQVALCRQELDPGQLTTLRDQLAEEFPAGDVVMNRELIRLLVYLQCSSIMDRYFDYLGSDADRTEKVHVAMYLRFLASDWTTDRKMDLFRFLQEAKDWDGGSSYPLYLGNAARDFARQLTAEESAEVLRQGAEFPDAALGALFRLPKQMSEDQRLSLQRLDELIDTRTDAASRQLMVGIVAVLARSGDDASMTYLRTIWDRNPERREPAAMGLAQAPHGPNWDYLVRSLPILESGTLREVLRRLHSVDRQPEDPEQVRQLILCGLRLGQQGAQDALALLPIWAGEDVADETQDWQQQLTSWQQWFVESFPDLPPATLPSDAEGNKWTFDELYEFLSGPDVLAGNSARGALVFQKATCDRCHRYGDVGEAMGPDLTGLTKRFTRKEILQSILYPSHVISTQYAAKNVLLVDGRVLSGILAPGPSGEKILLTSEGEKVSLREEDIDEIVPSSVSGMPEGLFKELTQEEIADLFSYMSADPAVGLAERPDSNDTEDATLNR
jgi:putative heme-binding domain-containing protein